MHFVVSFSHFPFSKNIFEKERKRKNSLCRCTSEFEGERHDDFSNLQYLLQCSHFFAEAQKN